MKRREMPLTFRWDSSCFKTFPAPYSLSINWEEMKTCQSGYDRMRESTHSPIPGFTPVDLLTAPDQADDDGPIGVAIEARDEELRFRIIESGLLLFPLHEIRGHFEVPGPLSLVEQGDMVDRRPIQVAEALVPEMMDVLNKRLDLALGFPLLDLLSPSLRPRDHITGERSWRILTRGPFPERKTLWWASALSMYFVAILSPTRVLPAPGTPVTKQIDFRPRSLASRTISEIASDVWLELIAPASLREISATECLR